MTYSLADYAKSKHTAGTRIDSGGKNEMRDAFLVGNDDYLGPRLCHYYDGVRAYEIADSIFCTPVFST